MSGATPGEALARITKHGLTVASVRAGNGSWTSRHSLSSAHTSCTQFTDELHTHAHASYTRRVAVVRPIELVEGVARRENGSQLDPGVVGGA